ncbi:MAG: hypothetical protein PHX18_01115 [Candidatus Gastranaerophilales bacterium]|nr:hypothetical protein [Candidatus Gastranaerophilales bacterium]
MKKLFLLVFIFAAAIPAFADTAAKIRQVNITPDRQELFMQRAQKNEMKYEKEAANKKVIKQEKPSSQGTSNFKYDDAELRNSNFYKFLDSNLNYSKESDAYSEGK